MPLQATSGAASYDGFGGGVPFEPIYIEQVFQTWLYTGNGSTQTITNNIDLSGKGGLVWIKQRDGTANHTLTDTARGNNFQLFSNSDVAQANVTTRVTAFNATGFDLGLSSAVNGSASTYASWTFREQPKFFDVVTYTGNGSATQTINHNLGSVPGCIIIKVTSQADDWYVYHRSLSQSSGVPYWLNLNTTAAETFFGGGIMLNATPTSTSFTVKGGVNGNGNTYVAYLFAHDAGGFGLSGSDNVISCGSYTGNGSATGPTVTLGYEPQWLLIKQASAAGNWLLQDNMRGVSTGGEDNTLCPNTADAENGTYGPGDWVDFTSTGFQIKTNTGGYNTNGNTYIYIAIRRGPMKTPTSGTSVYNAIARTGNDTASVKVTGVGFAPDLMIPSARNFAGTSRRITDRLRGPKQRLYTHATDAELTGSTSDLTSFDMDGVTLQPAGGSLQLNDARANYIDWYMRRAPGFFDVVCYTGTGSNLSVSHNLGAVPELMIVKRRNSSTYGDWYVYAASQGATKFLLLNLTDAVATNSGPWNNTAPTSSVFTAGSDLSINSTATYVAYLFATVAGVSKVGSYTGTGTTKQIDCGFTGGARFVLIKRVDDSGDWYVWDSARGIVAGNDPYLLLNSTAAEVTNTDYVDTYSAGFEISSTAPAAINANGGSFVFLAIA